MKQIILFALMLAPTIVLGQTSNGFARTGNKPEDEVLKVANEWIEALKKNDGPALERIAADDFHYFESDGRVRSKAEEIAPSKSGDIKFEQLSAEEVKIYLAGDTAFVTGIGTFRGSFKGRPFDGRERFFDVYQKRKGRWYLVASRPVALPTPKPPPATAPT